MSNGRTRGAAAPVALVVLDGWGYREGREGNAIELGRTPVWHGLWESEPHTLLDASGLAVGLPDGQMGNSEVGHLNLGAGRVVPQDLVRISHSIQRGDFFRLAPFLSLGAHLERTGGTLHLIGLIGNGGVHAIDNPLLAPLDRPHPPPPSAAGFVARLVKDLERIAGPRAAIASLVGRYYAMDRDKRWDRTRMAYELLVRGLGTPATSPEQAVREAYARGETDEFVKPIVLQRNGVPVAPLRDGDAVLCFNYRSDRMRQIVRALALPGAVRSPVPHRPSLALVTMTQSDAPFPSPQASPPFSLARILAEQLADLGRTQFHTAETEKYAHVTYFFNGGREPPYPGEDRVLVPSPRVATYDLAPEMSARSVAGSLCRALDRREHTFLLCNFANPDMVGHTGILPRSEEH